MIVKGPFYLNQLCRVDFYLKPLDMSISNRRAVLLIFIINMFLETPVFDVNGVDPDQTSRFVSSTKYKRLTV